MQDFELLRAVREKTFAEACAEMGISLRTGDRYRAQTNAMKCAGTWEPAI
jgi:hypothetical protein